MTVIPATEAKIHFGELLDKAQREPVKINKKGRDVAVVISINDYNILSKNIKNNQHEDNQKKKMEALERLRKWVNQPKKLREITTEDRNNDPRLDYLMKKHAD